MQLKSLRMFLDLAETGSFVATAERRHTVQSNVTAHVKKLEEELGVQLFHRKNKVQLTTAGRTLSDYAKRMLQAHDDALGLFNGEQGKSSQLRLGSMETTAAIRLPPILASFHRQYPEVELTLKTSPSAELLSQLLEGELDGVFVANRPEHKNLLIKKVFRERLVLVGPDPFDQFPSPEQLIEATFLAFRQGCSYRQRIELLLASYGMSSGKLFEFGSIDGILGCVAAGMGYTVMPLSTVEAHRQRFSIGCHALPPAIAELDTYFITAKTDTWTPALTEFVNSLNELTNDH